MVELLTDLQSGGTGEGVVGADLSTLVGLPLDQAAEQIANALAPENADKDLVRLSIQEAIAEALPEMEVFDPSRLTPDDIISLLVEFYSQILFREITSEAGDAWNKSDSPQRTVEAENELMDLIHAAVDRNLSPLVAEGLGRVSREEMADLQKRAIEDIWREWASQQ